MQPVDAAAARPALQHGNLLWGRFDGDWVATILERLEYRRDAADAVNSALPSTRDGWPCGDAGWQISYSKLFGEERWRDGQRPPMSDW